MGRLEHTRGNCMLFALPGDLSEAQDSIHSEERAGEGLEADELPLALSSEELQKGVSAPSTLAKLITRSAKINRMAHGPKTDELARIAPPAATGNAGPRFEAKVGAFYLLSVLTAGEPRGLPGAVTRSVHFQGAVDGCPFDDVIVHAVNADGSPAIREVQAKRTIDFTASNPEFADIVRRMWAAAAKPEFSSGRYELAVAIARTSTAIERACQEVLHWARQHSNAAAFGQHLQQPAFAADGMRRFVEAFRHHLAAAGARTDAETVWWLLRRFQILVFDFEGAGSAYENVVRERARMCLAADQLQRANELCLVLADEAQARGTAGGDADRTALLERLGEQHGFRFETRRDLLPVCRKLTEASAKALADIRDQVGGIRLGRADIVEACHQAFETARFLEIRGGPGVGKAAVLKHLALEREREGTVVVLAPGRIFGGGWIKMAHAVGCEASLDELLSELACGGTATLFVDNADQIDDEGEQITLRDLLRGVVGNPAWRAAVTVRSEKRRMAVAVGGRGSLPWM